MAKGRKYCRINTVKAYASDNVLDDQFMDLVQRSPLTMLDVSTRGMS